MQEKRMESGLFPVKQIYSQWRKSVPKHFVQMKNGWFRLQAPWKMAKYGGFWWFGVCLLIRVSRVRVPEGVPKQKEMPSGIFFCFTAPLQGLEGRVSANAAVRRSPAPCPRPSRPRRVPEGVHSLALNAPYLPEPGKIRIRHPSS